MSYLHPGVVDLSCAAIGTTMKKYILEDLYKVLKQPTSVVWVWINNTETNNEG